MRTACWVSVVALAVNACNRSPPPKHEETTAGQTSRDVPTTVAAPPTVVSSVAENGRTRVELQLGDGRRTAVLLARDATVSPEAGPAAVDVIAALPGRALVLVDRYPSVPGGMSYCQAGEERFIRIISVAGPNPRETLTLKVASCRENIELADRGVVWDSTAWTLRITWLTPPPGQPPSRTIRIGADGAASMEK